MIDNNELHCGPCELLEVQVLPNNTIFALNHLQGDYPLFTRQQKREGCYFLLRLPHYTYNNTIIT